MYMPKPKILFQYPHTSHLKLPKDVALSEKEIVSKLKTLFDLKHLVINQVVVSIEVNESQSDNKFTSKIMVTDGDFDAIYESSGDDFAVVINNSIHGFVENLRQENQKRGN